MASVSALEIKVDELTKRIDNMNETLLHMCHLLSQTISSSYETNKVTVVTDAEGTKSSSSETNKTTATSAEEGIEKDESKNRSSSSKKAQKKQRKAAAAAAATALVCTKLEIDDPISRNYGDVPFRELQSKEVTQRKWTEIRSLNIESKDKEVLIRGRVQTIRPVSNNIAFLVLRQQGFTVQCVVNVMPELVSKQMVKYASGLSNESIVDVYGIVSRNEDIKASTQKVEVQVRKIYCISRAIAKLPINFEDLIRSEAEIDAAALEGNQLARVNRDTRLDYRVLDLRTPANQAIFYIQCQVENIFRSFLLSKGFVGMHGPKLLAGSSEGGSAVFELKYYKRRPACLAQSPQLHKQIAICGDFNRVFEVGHVFRAEESYTHRHLCEFVGLDVEMEINEHYSEVMKVVDELFVAIFDSLNENCKRELEAVGKQFPFEPLKYLPETLQLTYKEGIQMLQKAGVKIGSNEDLNTETEKILGQLVLEKYGTEFYILHRYPLNIRPFYTMPCYDDPTTYSNSFDVFIRGEEIISGAQRIHDPEFLTTRAEACGIDVGTISTYIDSFRYGAPLHGGFGVGLERVVMLFCGLQNIRSCSLFPRDPNRLAP